jgi:hypothetical protein
MLNYIIYYFAIVVREGAGNQSIHAKQADAACASE